jgi:hypothetical protein
MRPHFAISNPRVYGCQIQVSQQRGPFPMLGVLSLEGQARTGGLSVALCEAPPGSTRIRV